MFSGADTEWLPTLGASWHVPQVPVSSLPMMSLSPPTPVMLMVRELNSVCPRRILARRAAASSVEASAQEAPPFADYARKVSTKSGEATLAGVGLSEPE